MKQLQLQIQQVRGVISKEQGDRTSKKSRYIPKRLVARVEKMEAEKVSVEEILRVLRNKSKK